jgi:hypothetical protein
MEFPQQIRVKGLPFMLQGWNAVYTKINEESDGCPVYHLEPYTLYWTIPIIGVRILRKNGIWRMKRDCDNYESEIGKYGMAPQSDPFGYWTHGSQVLPHH